MSNSLTTEKQKTSFAELKKAKNLKLLEKSIKANEKLKEFFAEYSKHGIITRACRVAGIKYDTIMNLKKQSPQFAELLKGAEFRAKDNIEYEIYERAVIGVAEPVVFMGRVTDTIIKKDNKLLLEMAKANLDKYQKENKKDEENISITNNITYEQAHEQLLDRLNSMQERPKQVDIIDGEYSEVKSEPREK